MRETVSWMEMHMRKPDLKDPSSLDDISFDDYKLVGGQTPSAELQCLSDLYTMFRSPPKELHFPRGLRFYDVLVLVRQVVGSPADKLTYPMLVIPESDLVAFRSLGLQTNTRPKEDCSSYPPKYVADTWLIALRMPWPSLAGRY